MEIIIAFIKVYVVIGWALVHSEMASRNLSTHLVSLGLDSHVKSQNMYNTQGWPIGWAKGATAPGPQIVLVSTRELYITFVRLLNA